MNYLEDKMMIEDPIVKEVRDARESIFASHDFDIEAYFHAVIKKQRDSGHPLVKPKGRSLQQGVAPNAYSLREEP